MTTSLYSGCLRKQTNQTSYFSIFVINIKLYFTLVDDNNIPVLKNMIGNRLVETSIMVPPNNVHNNNNKIKFKYGSVDKDVTLNIGNYYNDELAEPGSDY